MKIPFNKSYIVEDSNGFVFDAIQNMQLSGDGLYTKKVESLLTKINQARSLLTNSATSALELCASLLNLNPGDEVIMPSFTFVSTANAFILRGAVPVFVDIRSDTLNIDERLIEDAITLRTKAIVVVHYAGVSCEMDKILNIASKHKLVVIEDAAQGILSSYKSRPLGSIGHMGVISFHATKNINCGEGGAFVSNDKNLIDKAEILREKGTNRKKFIRGEVDKYTWVGLGSSYLPSELNAAYLLGQLDHASYITERRLAIWNKYQEEINDLGLSKKIIQPSIPEGCIHNGHIYYLVLPNNSIRNKALKYLNEASIGATFHYVPLHNSPFFLENYSRKYKLKNTESMADRIIRLPIWPGIEDELEYIINTIKKFILLNC